MSGFLCLTAFSIINLVASTLIMNPVDKNSDISNLMILSSVGTYVTSILFYAISLFVTTRMKKRSMSSKVLNLFFLFTFVLGGVYDATTNGEILRFFTPLRYFLYQDASVGLINIWFVLISLVLMMTLMVLTYKSFDKRDLTEI